ncbi:MAG: protein kinase [Candidatus Obscuribacterales bacterium]|nr:protein kinase [Candidatus Obscuribacterales bacterium]
MNPESPVRETHSFEKTLSVADIQTAREKHSLVGQILDGQYEILSMVGKGGMSIVYKARHLMLRKIVAIKTLLPHLVLHPHSLQRFQQEAQAASNIVHTNVVTIHNFGVTPEGQPYLVMDYLEGISLHQLIEDTGHLPIERAVAIFIQVANALDKAHEKGVIHRDLKPSNIILIEQGEKHDIVQLVDFGIAKLLPREGSEAVHLTQTGEVFGSPLYMSPEQCRGEKLDVRSDIYSMGCLMYECLAGHPPHSGDNTLEVLYKHINVVPSQIAGDSKLKSPIAFFTGSDIPSTAQAVAEVKVPSALEAIVFKALAKTPDGRYQSMAELERDLEAFQKSQQFSFLSIARSRWELFRLKRGPRSKSEQVTSAVWVSLSLVGLLGCSLPAFNFWNLADSPSAKQKIVWEDEKRKVQKKSDTSDLFAASIILKDADEFLHSNKGDAQEIYDSLAHAGKRLQEFGLWDEASKIFKKAVQVSNLSNGESSYPTILLKMDLAEAYYNQGKLKDAENEYLDLEEKLKTERRMLQYTLVLSSLGNCYFDEERYEDAEKYYKAAILAWRNRMAHAKESGAVEGQAKEFGLLSVSRLSLAALTFSRLAEIIQMKAENKLPLDKASDLGAETFYKIAAGCNFQALPMWRQTEGPDGKNTGICELHLAEDLAHLKEIQLTRKAPTDDTVQDQSHDMNAESLFESSEEIFKSAYGSAHPYLAIALLRHADYELDKKNNLKKYLQLRFKACSILSSAKNDLK